MSETVNLNSTNYAVYRVSGLTYCEDIHVQRNHWCNLFSQSVSAVAVSQGNNEMVKLHASQQEENYKGYSHAWHASPTSSNSATLDILHSDPDLDGSTPSLFIYVYCRNSQTCGQTSFSLVVTKSTGLLLLCIFSILVNSLQLSIPTTMVASNHIVWYSVCVPRWLFM